MPYMKVLYNIYKVLDRCTLAASERLIIGWCFGFFFSFLFFLLPLLAKAVSEESNNIEVNIFLKYKIIGIGGLRIMEDFCFQKNIWSTIATL